MGKKAFVFPGQGSQYVGMGKKLCENFKVASNIFDEASEAISVDLKKMCFEGNAAELKLTFNAQPAILTTSIAMYKVFMEEEGITPDIMVGHSLGEISALTCADAIKLKDAVKLARKRGEFMQQAVSVDISAMVAILSRDVEMIENLCKENTGANGCVSISNYNSRTQTVISGDKEAVLRVEAILAEKNIKTNQLNVSAPFHCALMKPAAEMFKSELEQYTFSAPIYPVLSNVTAMPYRSENDIIDNLTAQIVMPVQWVKSMQYLKKAMIAYGVELGPGNVLKNLMRTNVSDIKFFAYDNKDDAAKVKQHIKNSYIPFITRSMGIAVATKNNNWDAAEYKRGVIDPYNKVNELQQKLENEGKTPSLKEMQQAIDMLISVFRTKKTSSDEQIMRFKELFSDTGTEKLFENFEYTM